MWACASMGHLNILPRVTSLSRYSVMTSGFNEGRLDDADLRDMALSKPILKPDSIPDMMYFMNPGSGWLANSCFHTSSFNGVCTHPRMPCSIGVGWQASKASRWLR